ncbi:benzoate/H(+) symporter BenE family transporter [bacterium M00.F.Ca.ET.228.01.1.1]|uniref:benzoate/H(+) symporter BenE family transporter n=1 Tax=Paraburkholderia phenoliruptrix TaxID=252970 RepID=UPI00109281CD|nr:benzoate/H(+) symporter BenE family transporter [Paraburkholderia phenoliruptrix]TGP43341.1 benzoate/H(+) symporter BenE family transporter [bacterium M00.F.Ca.ET.228.01.1.1]TGS00780.1 benzoate/H(+) symporter BenE family transporter [bacterium M00.F.Ca.ET.191.01.1.1]TGU05167.1 benzoate/H(+) symporter BenE family transporter [bacterium M00.F.Ca.ET.155.01.1.1]MBW0450922.1 benzoate/H(+) symporter BenE family transporter [Paraburkholderia phenoliruptrix]MBW9099215.1 benzoate/H(+) symporter BenE
MRRSSSPELATAGIVPGRFNPIADTSLSAIVAGFVAMMTGYTSSLVLMFQAGQAAHLSNAQISSWIWALSIGMAVSTIGLSLRFRAPIVVAWSTPGAALLVSSLPHVPYAQAIGAFIVCALLLTVVGLTGWFDTLMKKIPAGIAAALLAGILFEIGIEIFRAAQFQTALVLTMFLTYLVVKRIAPRYAIPLTLIAGTLAAGVLGLLDFSHFRVTLAQPVFTMPSFSLAASISIGIPLFVVAMASQNVPGIAVLRADGYATPSAPLISTTGIVSLALAPFGSHGVNLAAITAAICTGPEAHENRDKRYTAAVWCGIFYLIAGVFGATIAALFAAFPRELVVSVAALALFGSIMSGLTNAMQDARQREAALVTFMVTASGLTLLSIGSAFWGLVAGVVTQVVLNARRA